MNLSPSGKNTLTSEVHLKNTAPPILVTPLGMVILVRLEQSLNALLPMKVTLLGITKLVRLLQDIKASQPM
jgi:hypothetical protein